jgi:hypothetical protein
MALISTRATANRKSSIYRQLYSAALTERANVPISCREIPWKSRGPCANAGNPDIRQIPAAYQNHVNQVLIHPPFQAEWKGAGAALVEIDPILAYQITVDSERRAQHISYLSCPPTEQQLFDVCLPTEPKTEQLKIFPGQNSLILKAKSLNVRIFKGIGQPNLMGVQFGVSPPYCHVVRHGGRCYLFNGYQRAVGLRLAGITHMPCILRDVKDHTDVD